MMNLSLRMTPVQYKTALARILALSPSLLIWPEQGAGWQGTSGGTLAASGQPLGLGVDLSQLGGKTLAEWLASAPELYTGGVAGGTAGYTNFADGVWEIWRDGGGSGNVALITNAPAFTGYFITLTMAQRGADNRTVDCRIVSGTGGYAFNQNLGAAGVYTFYVRTGNSISNIGLLMPNTGYGGFYSNISVKALPGNHIRAGTWATPSDAARGTFQNNAINFGGTNDYYSLLNAISITESMTVVRAFKRPSAGITNIGLSSIASTEYDHWWLAADNTHYWRLGSAIRGGSADTSTGAFVSSSRRNASTMSLRVNGASAISSTAPTVAGSLEYMGRISSVYNSGEISFLAVFPTELTGADLALVEQIAAATNGVVLA